jgi:hypothetical protein
MVIDEGVEKVLAAYHVCPNLGLIVRALLEGGPEGLEERCGVTPGVPVKPMLAKPSEGVQQALETFRGLWEKGVVAAASTAAAGGGGGGGVGPSSSSSSRRSRGGDDTGGGAGGGGGGGVAVLAEWKYDGQRAQIHVMENKSVRWAMHFILVALSIGDWCTFVIGWSLIQPLCKNRAIM